MSIYSQLKQSTLHKNMKLLETEFVSTPGSKAGESKFTQVQRDNDIAIYRRDSIEKKRKKSYFIGYEVSIIRKCFKGQPIRNGEVELEDRERYCGTESFGTMGFFTMSLDRAQSYIPQLMERLTKTQETQEENRNIIENGGVVKRGRKPNPDKVVNVYVPNGGKRGRPEVHRDIQLPTDKFTMSSLVEFTNLSQPILYIFLQKQIQLGKIKEVDRIKTESGRGKKAVVYQVI